jgi:hypothetical protein
MWLSVRVQAAVFGVVGVVLGSLLTIVGNYVLFRVQRGAAAESERTAASQRAREERKQAYLRLLTAARRLRYLAQSAARADPDTLDRLRTELSSAQYEIELIADADMAVVAGRLRVTTVAYVDAALRGEPTDDLRMEARRAVREMFAAAQQDLR